MATTFIYALKDPDTGIVRYVGKANNPKRRVRGHLCTSRGASHHTANFLKAITARGLKPTLEILDTVPTSEWQQWEVAWIEYFLEQGHELTNATPGGEGVTVPTPETNEKNRLAHLGKWHTPGAKEKVGIANRRKKKPSNKSGIVGVCFDKARRRWKASLMVNRREVRLGRFVDFYDAVFVRRLAEDKYFV